VKLSRQAHRPHAYSPLSQQESFFGHDVKTLLTLQ